MRLDRQTWLADGLMWALRFGVMLVVLGIAVLALKFALQAVGLLDHAPPPPPFSNPAVRGG